MNVHNFRPTGVEVCFGSSFRDTATSTTAPKVFLDSDGRVCECLGWRLACVTTDFGETQTFCVPAGGGKIGCGVFADGQVETIAKGSSSDSFGEGDIAQRFKTYPPDVPEPNCEANGQTIC